MAGGGGDSPSSSTGGLTGLLDGIERIGNALPDPATLFLLGAVAVLVLSQLAASLDWSVEKTVSRPLRQPLLDASGSPLIDPESGEEITVAVLDPETGRPRKDWCAS